MTHPFFVVGIDGSPASRTALRFAIGESAAHGGEVHAITCWSSDVKTHNDPNLPPCDSYENASRVLRTIIFEVSEDAREVSKVVREIDEGEAGPLLVAAAAKATSLVVGATHEGPIARLTGHTVTDYCTRHATVPVVVVPWVAAELEALDRHGDLRRS